MSAWDQIRMQLLEKIIDVNTGSVKVGRAGVMLRSSAIGSCIVIAAYDPGKKIGALAHIMLPGRAPKGAYGKRTSYAADAIDEMINGMIRAGANKCDLEVCLVEGANVLKKQDDTICKYNTESVTKLLGEKHIPVRDMVLGGTERKGASMDIGSGSVYYTEGDSKEKLLWKSTGKTR